jgi:hypothetical protein
MRRGNLEVVDLFKTEIAEFIPSVKPRLLRLWLAMTSEGPLAKTAKRLFQRYANGQRPHRARSYFSLLASVF